MVQTKAATDLETTLIEGFFSVLRDGKVERLGELVADDCADFDPLPGQLPGRAGVAQKVLLFRIAHPDAIITIESIEPHETGARATWTTTARRLGGAPGQATFRFACAFEIREGKIRSSKLELSARIDP